VNLDLYDRSYQLIESRNLELGPGERIAHYASELLSSAKTVEEGSIAIRSTVPLLALSLLGVSPNQHRAESRVHERNREHHLPRLA